MILNNRPKIKVLNMDFHSFHAGEFIHELVAELNPKRRLIWLLPILKLLCMQRKMKNTKNN